ncbi:hypothetical protein MPTK1_Vg00525 [Marchantia polymorpha subsp. ruderalis]|nr:hypothetical protein Mp_Vg00525 [Marchantia polymorpha subsp. ruderalis]
MGILHHGLTFCLLIEMLIIKVGGDILASSKLDICIVDSTDKSGVNCKSKMIIALTVVNGKSGESDAIETYVTGAEDKSGQRKKLAEPYRILIRKSDAYYRYPLSYLQQFNEAPYEEAKIAVNCADDKNDANPSCGWLYTQGRQQIVDSQGFCCRCSNEDRLPKMFGGKKASKRFPVSCSFWKKLFARKNNGSAHCLRMSSRWYSAFRVLESSLRFTVSITISTCNGSVPNLPTIGKVAETLTVSPESPVMTSYKKTVRLKLQGDFISYTTSPQLYDRWLSLPLIENSLSVASDVFGWMAIEKYRYTLDGKECNKIGVSFTAFRYQYGACVQQPQSCLANQLKTFREEDARLKRQRQMPIYSLSQYGQINTEHVIPGNPIKLRLNIKSNQVLTSVVTLEVVADGIRYFVNRSPGKIITSNVQDFEAMSRNGMLYIEVKNIGELTADFTIKVANCSEGIEIPDAKQISLPVPATVASYNFYLHSTDDKAKNRECSVNLLDSQGSITDVSNVSFSTTPTKYDNKSQDFSGKVPELKNETEGGWDFGFDWFDNFDLFGWLKFANCDDCRLPNIICFIWNFCWSQLVSSITGIITFLLGFQLFHDFVKIYL